tara:strand:+ start:144 stop:2189 length:2046 start_codon:yes stop_codon:yes gene_type:complete
MSKANVDDMMIAIQRAMIRGGDYGQAIRFIESQGYTMDEFLEAAGGPGSYGNMMMREGTFGLSDYVQNIAEAWAGEREDGEGFFDALKRHARRSQVTQQLYEMEMGIDDEMFSPSKMLAQAPLSIAGGLGLTKQLMKVPTLKTPTRAGLAATGIEGALYEGGTHPIESERLVDAMFKTGGGSMLAGGLTLLGGIGINKLYEKMIAKSPKGVQADAEEKIFDALFDYGEDPAEIVAKKKAAQKQFPGAGVESFDVSPGARDLAELGAQSMGKGRSDLADNLDARQEGQFDRLMTFLNEGLGEREDIVEAHGRYVLDASEKAKDLYKQVEGVEVDDMKILSFMQKKSWRDAYQQAKLDQAARKADGMSFIDMPGGYMRKLTPDGQPVKGLDGKDVMEWQDPPVYTIGMMDQVKQALDDVIFTSNQARRMGNPQQRSTGTMGSLKKLRYNFVNQLDDFDPDYKAARDEFSGHMEMADAIEMGTKFLSTPIDSLRKQFTQLKTKGARDAFRQAARAKIEERLGKLPEGVNKAEKLRTNDMMGRFQIIFKDDADFARAGQYFNLESQMSKSRSQLLANSRTERIRQLAEIMEASPSDRSLIELMLQGVSNPDQLYRNVQDMMKAAPSRVRDQIVSIIMDDDRLAGLSRTVPQRKMKRLRKEQTMPGLLTLSGGTAARSFEPLQQDY